MINIKIDNTQIKKMQQAFGADFDEAVKKHLKGVVGYAINQMGRQVRADVYSYIPKSQSYRRTGNLLGGRGSSINNPIPEIRELGNLKTQILANPQLKGAKYDYAPIVAKQKFRRGNFYLNTIKALELFVPAYNKRFKL